MAPEAIGTVIVSTLTGITGLVVALSGLRRTRNTQLREDLDICWEEQQHARMQFLAALEHLSGLEELLAANRMKIPQRPPSLDPGRTGKPLSGAQPRHSAG
jgi:hypothetical protein